jgi:penicillin-binding protein 1A
MSQLTDNDGGSTPPAAAPRRLLRSGWGLSRRWRLGLVGTASLIGLSGIGLATLFVYYTVTFPHPVALRQNERAPVIRILARDGAVLAERGAAHDFMPLELLPAHVIGAVVATEDRRFYQHWGLDPTGLFRAAFANLRSGRYSQGGSTITQQLAKNLFLSAERTMARKVEELALALWLEMRLSKHDILELYLNRVYFGGGAYGIEAAAQRYFEKSARELTIAEAALIAGLLKAPSKFSPTTSPGFARSRGRVALANMLAARTISADQYRRAVQERLRFADQKPSRDQGGAEYIVEFVLERLPPLLGAGHAEVVVETTLDAAFQRKAQAIVQHHLGRSGEASQAGQAALVVLDTDGGIRAMVGGRSFAESQFNRAVKSRRQPGSAFKPFVYLAALENGLTPDSIAYDLPLTVDGWSPRNDQAGFRGAMPLRQALAQSVNTVAVRLLLDAGAARVARTARRLGVKSEMNEGPALALGASELSLIELTGAYTILANGGLGVEPHAIRRVRMSSGRILYAREATRMHQIVAPMHVAAMNEMLLGAVASGTGRRAALSAHPAAGKTGTTQDFRDAWFVGYTAHLAGGVWVGNDNGKPMSKVMGGGMPAEIWHDVMTAAHEGRAPLALPGTTMTRPPTGPVPGPSPATGTGQPVVEGPTTPRPVATGSAAPSARSAPTTTTARAPARVMPRERIEPEFIERALAAEDKVAAPVVAGGGEPPGWADGGKGAVGSPAARPAGLMSLGGRD